MKPLEISTQMSVQFKIAQFQMLVAAEYLQAQLRSSCKMVSSLLLFLGQVVTLSGYVFDAPMESRFPT